MKGEKMKQQVNGGIGFFGLLTIVFITLKLCGVIAWSWWWVLSPILFQFVMIAICLVIMYFDLKRKD